MNGIVQTDDIVSALRTRGCDPTPDGNGYRAKCPCHDGDSFDALAVSDAGEIYCHKCEVNTGTVLKALGLSGQREGGHKPKVTIDGKQVTLHETEQSAIDGLTWSVFQKRGGSERAPDRVHRYQDAAGELVATIVLWDLADGNKEARQLSKHGDGWVSRGIKKDRPLYQLHELAAADTVYVCEGEKATDAIRSIGLAATTSMGGSGQPTKTNWTPLDKKRIVVIPDYDEPGGKYAHNVVELLRWQAPDATVEVVHLWDDWEKLPATGDAHDWVEHEDGTPEPLRLKLEALSNHVDEYRDAALSATNSALAVASHEYVRVHVNDDESLTNNDVADALGGVENLYKMGGQLTRLIQPEPDGGYVSKVLVPKPLTALLLREVISHRCKFYGYDSKGNKVERPIPYKCPETIVENGRWPQVPPLTGVVASPVLRPDGTIVQTAGYDAASKLYVDLRETFPVVPDNPTTEQVADSVALLFDIVAEFPFVNDAHRAAWLAAVLTPLARHTYDGITGPMILFDAPDPGSGKGLLVTLAGIIALGQCPASNTWKQNEAERSKAMLAELMQRPQVIFFDNVDIPLGGATINKVITDLVYSDRILKESKTVRVPVIAQFWATGNNVVVNEDTRRRIMHCRLEANCEQPERRDGWKYSDLAGHVSENRPELLCAALTILRGYFAAGKPKQTLTAWGSFERWSGVVRSAIVWAGLPDIGECMVSGDTIDDGLAQGMESMIAAFLMLDPDFEGVTAKQIAGILKTESYTSGKDEFVAAFEHLTDKPVPRIGTRDVGAILGKLKSKVSQGYKLKSVKLNGKRCWILKAVETRTPKTPKTSLDGCSAYENKKNIGVINDDIAQQEPQPFIAPDVAGNHKQMSVMSLVSVPDPDETHPDVLEHSESPASPEPPDVDIGWVDGVLR
ncbi:MAG: hypothetical protein ABGZ53_01855 [Fuerstiella sp.]